MTLQEIVQQVQNMKDGGITSSSIKMSNEQIADIVHYYRAKLIRQEIDRGMKLDTALIQPLFSIEVERVKFDRSQPLSGKTVFKTTKKIPRAIATKGPNLITFVGHNLLGQAFQRTTLYKAQLDIYRPFTALNIKWFEFNEHIYLITEDSLKEIVIQLVVENPTKVIEFNNQLDVYSPFNYEYPLSVTMLDSLFKLMADMELKYGSIPTDDINDGLEAATNK